MWFKDHIFISPHSSSLKEQKVEKKNDLKNKKNDFLKENPPDKKNEQQQQ